MIAFQMSSGRFCLTLFAVPRIGFVEMILTAEIGEAARQAMNDGNAVGVTDVCGSAFNPVWRYIKSWDEKIVLEALGLLVRANEMERIFGVENTALEPR